MTARRKRALDRWVTPGAQKMLVGMGIVGMLMFSCAGISRLVFKPNPAFTPLEQYDLTPAEQRVRIFEFNAARDRALIVASVVSAGGTTDRGRVEVYLWDAGTRQSRSLGQFNGVATQQYAWDAAGDLIRASDGSFFLVAGDLLRIAPDGQVTAFRYGNRYGHPLLTPEELRAIHREYGERPKGPIQQIGSFRLYEFAGGRVALVAPYEQVGLTNPVVVLDVPRNPDYVPDSTLASAWSDIPYQSAGEQLKITTRSTCPPLLLCISHPKLIVRVDKRQYVFGSIAPFVPRSKYITAADGTLFWLRQGSLYVLR